MIRSRRGFALLESLVALTIVTTVGVSVVLLGREALRGERAAAAEEDTLASADRVMVALSLLRRPELEQRLGRHELGEFTVNIERPELSLFRVAIAQTSAPMRELLVTVVYRPVERVE
jgi:type II secretory pathway component PulJ